MNLVAIMEEFLKKEQINAQMLREEPMSRHTSFHIGGPARVMVIPKTMSDLAAVASFLKKQGLPWFILGKGTNLLVPDGGLDKVVLKTAEISDKFSFDNTIMNCPSGASMTSAAMCARRQGLSGLEFSYGIPGTVGGAVYMNAGAYDGEMKDVILETIYLDENGTICTVRGKEHNFSYRHSLFSDRDVLILETKLQLSLRDSEEIQKKMDDFMERRKSKQPLEMPSAGSVFKRPDGYFAGKLIQDCNLMGVRIGGAMISEKHAGFIVNAGGATAKDVNNLVAHIQKTVQERFGILLECEIKRL